jgi:hypothetical protein
VKNERKKKRSGEKEGEGEEEREKERRERGREKEGGRGRTLKRRKRRSGSDISVVANSQGPSIFLKRKKERNHSKEFRNEVIRNWQRCVCVCVCVCVTYGFLSSGVFRL